MLWLYISLSILIQNMDRNWVANENVSVWCCCDEPHQIFSTTWISLYRFTKFVYSRQLKIYFHIYVIQMITSESHNQTRFGEAAL